MRLTDLKNMLTITEAAEMIGKKRQTIHCALTSIPPRANGEFIKGRWFISKKEVLRVWGNQAKSA
jgi:predicted DNA-binding protein (UPF0251 family)